MQCLRDGKVGDKPEWLGTLSSSSRKGLEGWGRRQHRPSHAIWPLYGWEQAAFLANEWPLQYRCLVLRQFAAKWTVRDKTQEGLLLAPNCTEILQHGVFLCFWSQHSSIKYCCHAQKCYFSMIHDFMRESNNLRCTQSLLLLNWRFQEQNLAKRIIILTNSHCLK